MVFAAVAVVVLSTIAFVRVFFSSEPLTLVEARRALHSKLLPSTLRPVPFEPAPAADFRNVQYPAAVGPLRAYLTPDPGDGKQHPAIVWITGGDCNSIGDVWSAASADNDQTAAAYRKAGVVMLFPSMRGGNDNPGQREGFLGEVDDVIAAHAYLSKIPYVDTRRIYLGGHSTGGTLVLLVAESFNGFAGVIAFGPVTDVRAYGEDSGLLPYDLSDPAESKARSPGHWLHLIRSPAWIVEGEHGNIDALRAMRRMLHGKNVVLAEISNASHFSALAPLNALLAGKIAAVGADGRLDLGAADLDRTFQAFQQRAGGVTP
ncbi:MAG TPA: prolyl oligopeptidase family serine peptidase [Myxococcales bacterium]|jgi:dipeptidyl aminopeptidase/acylaminoacyl peptidase